MPPPPPPPTTSLPHGGIYANVALLQKMEISLAALFSTSKKHLSKFDLQCFVRPWTMGRFLNAHEGAHINGTLKM